MPMYASSLRDIAALARMVDAMRGAGMTQDQARRCIATEYTQAVLLAATDEGNDPAAAIAALGHTTALLYTLIDIVYVIANPNLPDWN